MSKKVFLILFHFIVLSLFAYLGANLKNEFSISDILGKKNPEVQLYNEYREKYDDEKKLFILLTSKKENVLQETSLLTSILLNTKYLANVSSINLLQYLNYESLDHRVSLRKFINKNELTEKGRLLLERSDLFRNYYLSEDKTSTLVSLEIKNALSEGELRTLIENLIQINKDFEKKHKQSSLHLLGTKVASYYFNQELLKQQIVISPFCLLTICLFLFFIFRSFKVVLLGLYYMSMVFVICAIIIFYFENTITPYTNFSLFFIYVMATSDFIHFCTALESGKSVLKVCFYTSLTTAVAFLSLYFSPIEVISDFGLYSAIGIVISYVLNFYFIPYIMDIFKVEIRFKRREVYSRIGKNYLGSLENSKKSLFVFSLLIFFGFVYSFHKIVYDDSLYDKFVEDHKLTQAVYAFNDKFQFTGSIDLVQKIDSTFLTMPYRTLQNKFVADIEQLENVSKVSALGKYITYIENEINPYGLKEKHQDIVFENIFDFFNQQNLLDKNFSRKYSEERFTIYLKSLKSSALQETITSLESLIERYDLDISINGFAPIRLKMLNSILDGVIYNLIGTLLVVFFIFCYAFKSIKLALVGMVPNLFPIFTIMTLFSLFNIAIEDSLILMLCSVIGISVDDTLHYIFSYQNEIQNHSDKMSIKNTYDKTHFALFSTTFLFILVSPFYFLSDLKLIHEMAIFFNVGLLIALLYDFYLLPHLLKFIKRKI